MCFIYFCSINSIFSLCTCTFLSFFKSRAFKKETIIDISLLIDENNILEHTKNQLGYRERFGENLEGN